VFWVLCSKKKSQQFNPPYYPEIAKTSLILLRLDGILSTLFFAICPLTLII